MNFKEFYEDKHIFDCLLTEDTSEEDKTSIEKEAKKIGF